MFCIPPSPGRRISVKRLHAALQCQKLFHLAIAPPGLEMTYRRPLNALPMWWQVFRPYQNVLHPSWRRDNVSSSTEPSNLTLGFPRPFHLAMASR